MEWQPIKRWALIGILGITASVILPIAAGFLYLNWSSSRSNQSTINANRPSTIENVIGWIKLQPFPVPESNLIVKSEGTTDNREYIIRFKASKNTVKKWIRGCSGLKGLKPIILKDGFCIYQIKPGKDEVFISADGSIVTVKAFPPAYRFL